MSSLFRSAMSLESSAVLVDEATEAESALALENATVEMMESGHAVEMGEYQQEELAYAHTKMASIADAIGASLENNSEGMTREEAQMASMAVEAVTGGAIESPVVSLESFGGASERVEATTVSLENFKAKLGQIWTAIKNAVIRGIAAVGEWIKTFMDSTEKMEKRLQELNGKISNLNDSDKPDSVKATASAMRLQMGGKFDKATVMAGVSVVGNELVKATGNIVETAIKYFQETEKFYKSKSHEVKDMETSEAAAAEDFEKTIGLSLTQELPGGKTIQTASVEKSDGLSTVTPPTVTDHPQARKYSGDGSIDGLSTGELKTLADQVSKGIKSSQGFDSKRISMNTARENTMKAADAWIKEIEGKGEQVMTQAKLSWTLRRANRGFTRSVTSFDRYMFNTMRGYMTLIEANVNAYGGKKSEEKED